MAELLERFDQAREVRDADPVLLQCLLDELAVIQTFQLPKQMQDWLSATFLDVGPTSSLSHARRRVAIALEDLGNGNWLDV